MDVREGVFQEQPWTQDGGLGGGRRPVGVGGAEVWSRSRWRFAGQDSTACRFCLLRFERGRPGGRNKDRPDRFVCVGEKIPGGPVLQPAAGFVGPVAGRAAATRFGKGLEFEGLYGEGPQNEAQSESACGDKPKCLFHDCCPFIQGYHRYDPITRPLVLPSACLFRFLQFFGRDLVDEFLEFGEKSMVDPDAAGGGAEFSGRIREIGPDVDVRFSFVDPSPDHDGKAFPVFEAADNPVFRCRCFLAHWDIPPLTRASTPAMDIVWTIPCRISRGVPR